MKILVTGGAGFTGSCFIRYMLNKYPDYKIINLDLLTYAGNPDNLKDLYSSKHTFIEGDICNKKLIESLIYEVDCCINFAAESNVDKSIKNSKEFIKTNVLGTHNILECAKESKLKRFIQVSTTEVYGTKEGEAFTEKSPVNPSNPYSASKASADILAKSYFETYKIPVVIARSSNVYGPFQYPEKLIPLFIQNLLADKKVALYGDGLNVRDWVFVYDNCTALDRILHRGREGQIYNISGNCEKTNKAIAQQLVQLMDKDFDYIDYVEDRPGHEKCYSVDSSKLKRELGWIPETGFDKGIEFTVQWYLANQNWLNNIKLRQDQTFSKHKAVQVF